MKRKKAIDFIIKCYYFPKKKRQQECYEKNIALFKAYKHQYGFQLPEFEQLAFICIEKNVEEFYVFFLKHEKFLLVRVNDGQNDIRKNINGEDRRVVSDVISASALEVIEKNTFNVLWMNSYKTPIYILWDTYEFLMYFQMQNYSKALESKRFVFFSDLKKSFQEYFDDVKNPLPNCRIGWRKDSELDEAIRVEAERRIALYKKNLEEVQREAQNYNKNFYRDLFNGSKAEIRILFYTSRFTRVVQHSTKAMMRACQAQGITCQLLIEDDDIQLIDSNGLVSKIAEFKPNVIFRINFFRDFFAEIPKGILFWTWVQDPMGGYCNEQNAQKFLWNDFAMALPEFYCDLKKNNYDTKRIVKQIMTVDESAFYPQVLTATETAFYKSDIALPSNYNLPGDAFAELICEVFTHNVEAPLELKQLLSRCLIRAYDSFQAQIESDVLIASIVQCENEIKRIAKELSLVLPMPALKAIAQKFYQVICYGLHRRITLQWVSEAGFSLKLWGRDWEKDSILKKFSCGLLQPGDELAKMYSATKIILATFSHYTGHFRVFEALSCGALPLVRYIPKENDQSDFRDFFVENEHFVFYYNKNDLIEKIRYYLANEEERKRIVKNGQRQTAKFATYEKALCKFLKMVRENMN